MTRLLQQVAIFVVALAITVAAAADIDDVAHANILKKLRLEAVHVRAGVNAHSDENLLNGIEAFNKRNYADAIDHFRASIRIGAKRSNTMFLAVSLHASNEQEAALEAYTQSLTRFESPTTLYNRALIHLELGNIDRAITDLDRAIELSPSIRAYNNRAVAHVMQRNVEQAEHDLTSAIGIYEKNFNAFFNRGLVRELRGDYKAALSDYEQALSINSESKEARRFAEALKWEMNGGEP